MASLDTVPANFEVGVPARATARFLLRHWAWLLPLALLLLLAPQLAFRWLVAYPPVAGLIPKVFLTGSTITAVIQVLVVTPPSSILTILIIRQAARDLDAVPSEGLRPIPSMAPAVIVAQIMVNVASVVAGVFFVIPGILVWTAWFLVAPVIVLENGSPIWSLGRSANLTRDQRWPIFVLVLILNLAWIPLVLAAYVAVLAFEPFLLSTIGASFGEPRIELPVALSGACSDLVSAVAAAVLYFELLRLKSGLGGKAVAAVFD